jgi:hypothetical protein
MQRCALRFRPIDDIQEVLRRAGESVELRHDQSIALPDEIQTRFELRSLLEPKDIMRHPSRNSNSYVC